MRYDILKTLKLNKQGIRPCVVIQTGEEGIITQISQSGDGLLVKYHSHGMHSMQEQWFNYTEIAVW